MVPVQIKVIDKSKLMIKWEDNSEITIGLKYLRNECPCAVCKGETVLLKKYRPAKPSVTNAEGYKLKDIQPIGEYAIQLTWKDGHNTGIYSWDYLTTLAKNEDNGNRQDYKDIL